MFLGGFQVFKDETLETIRVNLGDVHSGIEPITFSL